MVTVSLEAVSVGAAVVLLSAAAAVVAGASVLAGAGFELHPASACRCHYRTGK